MTTLPKTAEQIREMPAGADDSICPVCNKPIDQVNMSSTGYIDYCKVCNLVQYEDELPEKMPIEAYELWFKKSRVVGGVRMGPVYAPNPGNQRPAIDAARKAAHVPLKGAGNE